MSASAQHREPIDVLAEEFLGRFRRGERPAISEYAEHPPDLADDIRDLFPTLVVMEQAGASATSSLSGSGTDFCCPERLGEFRILREVGRGGMGVVYEAIQEPLDRRVALKVLPLNTLLDRKHLGRFQREARAAAQLHHSHIVPVFGVGVAQGVHYFAMQFIDGQSLDQILPGVEALRRAQQQGVSSPASVAGHCQEATPAANPRSTTGNTDTVAQTHIETDADLGVSSSLRFAAVLGSISYTGRR
jgi:hypothetical protein